jgi:2-(3-amino-3-carboxypropyl)histidine synthase
VKQLFDLELDRIVNEIKKRKAARILIQLPDGMKSIAFTISKELEEKTDSEIILSGGSCYGGCDLATNQAINAAADLIVHFGHSRFVLDETEVPVMYIEARVHLEIPQIIDKIEVAIKKYQKIGLTATIQNVHQLQEIAQYLEKNGFKTFIGSSTEKIPYKGQVLGCDYTSVKNVSELDVFLFIGPGLFHPTGLALVTKKPVIAFNPFNGMTQKIGEKDIMNMAKKRMAAITIAKNAKKIGIIVSTKPGQFKKDSVSFLKEDFKENGVDTSFIYVDEIRLDTLQNFTEADAYIVTACPRIPIDGFYGFKKPLLTVNEALVVLGKLTWEKLWNSRYLNYADQSLYYKADT